LRRFLALAVVGVAALGAVAATCQVRNISLTVTDGEHDTFAGELFNDSGVDILQHEYRVSFLDDNNNVIDQVTVPGCLRSIQAGESDFFSATSDEDEEDTETGLARLANFAEDPDFEIGETETGDIALSGISVVRNGDELTVSGTVKNEDSDQLDNPFACAVVFNEDDDVVIVGRDTDINDLDEDEQAPFTIELTVPDSTDDVDTVDVYVDGLEDGVPVNPASDVGNEVEEGTATPATPSPTRTPTATPTP
jgi:hypothetical protein